LSLRPQGGFLTVAALAWGLPLLGLIIYAIVRG